MWFFLHFTDGNLLNKNGISSVKTVKMNCSGSYSVRPKLKVGVVNESLLTSMT